MGNAFSGGRWNLEKSLRGASSSLTWPETLKDGSRRGVVGWGAGEEETAIDACHEASGECSNGWGVGVNSSCGI